MTPEGEIRRALNTSTGARVMLRRADLEALLASLVARRAQPAAEVPAPRPSPEGAVVLTIDDAEVLAIASWETAIAERVERYGHWSKAPENLTAATTAAAARTLHYLLTGATTMPDNARSV